MGIINYYSMHEAIGSECQCFNVAYYWEAAFLQCKIWVYLQLYKKQTKKTVKILHIPSVCLVILYK